MVFDDCGVLEKTWGRGGKRPAWFWMGGGDWALVTGDLRAVAMFKPYPESNAAAGCRTAVGDCGVILVLPSLVEFFERLGKRAGRNELVSFGGAC